jgi:hypothetical protein
VRNHRATSSLSAPHYALLFCALHVGDDEADHAIVDVLGKRIAQGLEELRAELVNGNLYERAVALRDVA